MIVADPLGRHLISDIEIHTWLQLDSIYVLHNKPSTQKQGTQTTSKFKGVYTQIESVGEALKFDAAQCDRAMTPMSFNGIDPLFMYTQLLKEALLQIEEDDTKSIKELVDYCRLQDDIPTGHIDKVEREYRDHTPIWWYTTPYFIYSMLNRGLRLMDVDIILKMGFFIRHLHKDIETLHRKQQSTETLTESFQVYRGQGLSLDNFKKMQNTTGGLMSFNNFLSTSRDYKISFMYAQSVAMNNDLQSVSIIFVMTIQPTLSMTSSIPFVDVRTTGYFEEGEEEILFSTHSIFRINQIQHIHDDHTDRLWQVNLTLVSDQDNNMKTLTTYLSQNLTKEKGWSRLGDILIHVGEYSKAEHLYHILLHKASSNTETKHYNDQLAIVYQNLGEYTKALSYYKDDLERNLTILPPNHPQLATTYHNIGLVYLKLGDHSKALSSHERSLEIRKVALHPNHPDLATSYNNIGEVYRNMSQYTTALSAYEQSLDIMKNVLPPNHPDLSTAYNNIGAVYAHMGDYVNALSSYVQSLEITKISLPPNHPDLGTSYNNIAGIYSAVHNYKTTCSQIKLSEMSHIFSDFT
ncbi:unnamed protein product [Rotaria magnacalcarata]|uniref:Kinesin light chain n=1 Tax=Rotaria magnacalcarata TaxID=392030 RepID=A0A814WSN4_9BILA|nr:unnamed protein product [Rotaria magnacalcarata]CAF4421726.1 unnamed protein product [Rotaria magnacalcarata]